MRITVKIGIIFALLWIALKMVLFLTLQGEYRFNLKPAVLTNILFLLMAISIGLFIHKRNEKEQSNALGDIKNAMSAGVPYTLIVGIFLYFYYAKIDTEFIQHQTSEHYTALEKELNDPIQFKKLKAANEDFEVMTKEQIEQSIKDNIDASLSPGSTMTLSLLGMLILSTINSIFVTVIYRKIVFR